MFFLCLVYYQGIWLVNYLVFVSRDLEVPLYLSHSSPLLERSLSSTVGSLVLLPQISQLNCLMGIFAQTAFWILPGTVDPSLYGICSAVISVLSHLSV